MEDKRNNNLLKYFFVGIVLFIVGLVIGLTAYPYLFEKNDDSVQKVENNDKNEDEENKEQSKEKLQEIEVNYQVDVKYLEDNKLEYNPEECGTGNLHYTFSFDKDKTLVINNLKDGKIISSSVVMDNVDKVIKYYRQAACDEFEFVILTNDGKIYMTEDINFMNEIDQFKDMLFELNYSNYSTEKVRFTDIKIAEEIYDLYTENGVHWALGIVATTEKGEKVFFINHNSIKFLVK